MLEDAQAGSPASLGYYKAQFPGYEELVEAEYRIFLEEHQGQLTANDGAGAELETFGRFQILKNLGRGGQGRVVLARDPEHGMRLCALKILDPTGLDGPGRKRLEYEAQSLVELGSHPSICTFYEVGMQGLPYLAMEYIAGRSLEAMLGWWDREQVSLGTPAHFHQVVTWFQQAAEALEFAHTNRVLHRDVKAANLVLDEGRNRMVLVDFGMAKSLRQQSQALTASQEMVGTLDCMAPEQTRFEELDVRTDVYSLGLVLYRALTLDRPRPERASDESIRRHRFDQLGQVRARFGKDVVAVLSTACAPRRGDRYTRAIDMARDLERLAGGEKVRARVPSTARQLGEWSHSRPGLVRGIAAILAILASATTVSLVQLQKARIAGRQSRLESYSKNLELARTYLTGNQFYVDGQVAAAYSLLDATDPELRGFEWGVLRDQVLPQRLSPIGQRVLDAVAPPDGSILMGLASGEVLRIAPGEGGSSETVCQLDLPDQAELMLGPQGRFAVIAELPPLDERTETGLSKAFRRAKVVSLRSEEMPRELNLGNGALFALKYRPDGGLVGEGKDHRYTWEPDQWDQPLPLGAPIDSSLALEFGEKMPYALLQVSSASRDSWLEVLDFGQARLRSRISVPGSLGIARLSTSNGLVYFVCRKDGRRWLYSAGSLTGQPVRRVSVPIDNNYSLSISPDGRFVAISESSGSILYDSLLRGAIATLHTGDEVSYPKCFFDSGGKRFLAITSDAELISWSAPWTQHSLVPGTQTFSVGGDLVFSEDGRYMTWGSKWMPHRWVDLELGIVHECWEGSSFTPIFEGHQLYLPGEPFLVIDCDRPDAAPLQLPEGAGRPYCKVDPVGRTSIIQAGWEQAKFLRASWDAGHTEEVLFECQGVRHWDTVGPWLVVTTRASESARARVHIVHRAGGSVRSVDLPAHTDCLTTCAWREQAALGFSGGQVGILDLTTGRLSLLAETIEAERFQELAFHPFEDRLVGAQGSQLHVWSLTQGRRVVSLKGSEYSVLDIGFSPRGELCVVTRAGVSFRNPRKEFPTSWNVEDAPATGGIGFERIRSIHTPSLFPVRYLPDYAIHAIGLPREWYEQLRDLVRLQEDQPFSEAFLSLHLGDWEAAERSLAQTTHTGFYTLIARMVLALHQGEFGQAEELYEACAKQTSDDLPVMLWARSLLRVPGAFDAYRDWAESGDVELGRKAAEAMGVGLFTSVFAGGPAEGRQARRDGQLANGLIVSSLRHGMTDEELLKADLWCRQVLERVTDGRNLLATWVLVRAELGERGIPLDLDSEALMERLPSLDYWGSGSLWVLAVRAFLGVSSEVPQLEAFDVLRRRVAAYGVAIPIEIEWLMGRCQELLAEY